MASIQDRLKAAAEKARYEEDVRDRLVKARDAAIKAENFTANYVEPMTGSERSDRANTVAARQEREAAKEAEKAAAFEESLHRFDLGFDSPMMRSIQDRETIKELEGELEHAQGMYDTYSQLHGSYQTSPEEKKVALEQKNRFEAEAQRLETQLGAARENATPSPFLPQYDNIPLYSDFDVYSKEPEVNEPADDMSVYLKDINAKVDEAMSGTPVLEVEREDDFNFLTDTERGIYTYLKNKYGEGMAKGYLDNMSDTIAQRRGGKIAQTLENQEGPARVVQTGGFAMRSGLEQFGQGAEQAFKDDVQPVTPVQYGAQYVREDLADVGPKVLGSSIGQIAFDTTQTVGNMLPSMIISMGAGAFGAPVKLAKLMGAGAMGTSAGGNTYATAVREGMAPDEAREYARLVGIAAGSLQYAIGGIDKLSGGYGAKLSAKAAGIENGFLRFIAKHGANALSEASEEALEAILDPIFREIATGDDADIDWSEVVYNALLGGLTGTILGGNGDVADAQPNAEEETGRVPRLPRVTNAEEEIRTVPPLPRVGTNAESTERGTVPPLPKVGTNTAAQSDAQGRVPSLPTVEGVRQRAVEADRQAEREKAQKIADKLGVKLNFQSLGANRRGMYENGVITLNSDRDDPVMEVFVHELTHHLESSGNYGRLRNAALSYISENMGANLSTMKADVVAEYAEGGIELDDAGAERELVAQFCSEMVFTDEESIIRLARRDRNLAQRIYDWICDTISKIGKNADARALINARRMYENALRTVGDTQGEARNLYAGERAQNADLRALAEARNMEAQGRGGEEIRQKTGWFRGADGKWRFEIDDSGMEYNRQGYTENPDMLRRRELEVKLLSGEISEEEYNELRALTDATKGVPGPKKLGDYIKHEALFEAYPELRNASLTFEELPEGVKGRYNPERNTVTISEDIRNAPERVLVHEIQHAVQNAEGFSPGANLGYWQSVLEQDEPIYSKGMGESLNRLVEFEANNREAVEMAERIEEALRTDDDGADYEAALDEAEERGLMDAVMEYDELRSAFYAQKARPGNRVPSELYRDTAGEIEARDAAGRWTLTPEQRREIAPDTGNGDTVFAESSANWLSADDPDATSIKEQIEGSRFELNNMDVVASATVPVNMKKKDAAARWASEVLKRWGGHVDRQGYGNIYFSQKDIDKGLRYADTPVEKAALAVMPQVLKKGIEVGSHGEHKGRNKQTVTFAAPVELNGIRGNMGVVVNRNGNHYYAHRIVLPDGTAFQFATQKENATQELSRGVTVSGSLADTTSAASTNNVAENSGPVKASYGSSFEERARKAGGKVSEKSQQQKAAEKKQRVTIAKRDLRRDLLGLFSVPEGQRGAMGSLIDSIAEESLKNGEISVNDRERLFDTLYESGVVTQQADEYLSVGRSAVVGGHIYVSEYVRSEFGDDWNSFRRRAFGAGVYLTSNFSDPGVDVWNAELADILPGLFDAGETDSRTMLENIVDIAEAGKDEKLSLSDYTARIAKQEHISETELIEHMERQVDWALRSFGEKAKLELWFKQKMDEKVQAEREKSWEKRKEQIHRQKENRELRELQQRTLKQLQWLSRNRHKAPADLRAAWDEVLSDIDIYAINAANEMNWSNKHQATWKDLAQLYKDAKESDPNFLPSKELEQIVSRLDDRKIGDMDIDALSDLYKAAVGLRTEFYNRNNVIADESHRLFSEVYRDSVQELGEARGHYTGKTIDRLFNIQQLTPMNVFQRMVGWNPNSTWYGMGRQLEKGERDMRAYHVEANKQLEEFLRENEKWVKQADGQGKDAVWYKITVPELLELNMGDKPIFGDTVTVYMTPAQKVHLYLESKSEDNLRHMTGGRTFVNKELYSKGKRSEALAHGKTIKLAPETVKKLVSDLTPTEMELAALLERYYNGFAKDKINTISNVLYGFDKAVGRNYAPIYTNKNYTNTEIGIFDATAEGVGNLKARQYSKNPSYNLSAFDAFERHIDQTARFVGMAIPARNWTTLLNWRDSKTSMADELTHKWGNEGKDYITGLIADLQAGKSLEKDVVSDTADKIFSKYVSAVFGANPSIVLKQLGSIPLASVYLDAKNIPSPRQIKNIDRALISKYTSELDHRTMGYSMPETKLLKDNPGWVQTNKFANFTFGGGAITAMDGWAASTLWPWAENKVKRDFPELEIGTQEQIDAGKSPFYQKVAEVFDNAVARTQSVSDETHQSTIRKSRNPLTRTFTMFKSDAAQGYNVLRQKIGEAQYYKRTGADRKTQSEANRAAGGAVLALGAGYLYAQGISFLINLWKNQGKKYEDEEEELSFGSVAKQMCIDLVSDFAGMVVGGGELAEVIGNVLSGEKWYGIETPGSEQLTDLVETIMSAFSELSGVVSDASTVLKNGGDVGEYFRRRSGDILGVVKDAAQNIATYIGGISVNNVEAYLLGGLRWISPALAEAYDAAFDSSTKTDLSGLEGDALAVRVYGVLENRLDEVEEETSDALAALYEAGNKGVIPSDTPSKITVDGEEIALNAYQQQMYDKVWCDSVRGTIDEVVASEEFAAADNAGKEKLLKRLYEYAAAMAKSAISDEYEAPKWVGEVNEAMRSRVSFAEMASEGFVYWDGSSQANSYDEFVRAGVSAESAKDLADAIDALQPIGDAKRVSDIQKLRAIANSGLNAMEKDAALGAVMSESQLESWHLAKSEIPLNDFIDGIEIKNNAEGVKDANGEIISGSKAFAVMQGIDDLGMSDEKKEFLFEALGYDTAETIWNTEYEGNDYEAYFYMTDSARQGYMDYCSWMEAGDYAEYYEAYSTFFSDKDSNGKTVKAKKEKVIEYIDSLDLTADQKSALFVSFGYAKSSLKDCIWYNPIAMRSKYFPAW